MKISSVTTMPVVLMIGAILACSPSNTSKRESLSSSAQQGKVVFQQYDCNKCHYVGDEVVGQEAPDLLNPFLANDSMFVRAHLKFVAETDMPALNLREHEIRLVSQYVGELHAARRSTLGKERADAICSVCYAPVSTKQAKASKLYAKFLGEEYYFECAECLKVFRRSPEAFIELLKQRELESSRTTVK